MSRCLRHLLAALLLGTAALTAGCAALFLQNIYDIRLESFEIVSLDDHPELHPERSSTPRPTYLAQIHFSTTRDLVAFVPKNQAIEVSFRASECYSNEIDKKRLLGGPYVYNRFGEVDFRNENPVAESPISGGRYLYYSFVHLIGYGNGTINNYTRPAYDLGQQPTDLCFVIRGGSMLGVSFTSNLQPPTSNLQPPTSNLQPPTSNLQPPTSNLQPPTSPASPPPPFAPPWPAPACPHRREPPHPAPFPGAEWRKIKQVQRLGLVLSQ